MFEEVRVYRRRLLHVMDLKEGGNRALITVLLSSLSLQRCDVSLLVCRAWARDVFAGLD